MFELLADARDQVRSVTDAVQALRDHWAADANLQTALTGRSPAAGGPAAPSRAAASPAPAGH